jgi:hypothetical protein
VTYLQLHSDKTGRRNSGYKLENTWKVRSFAL